VALQKIERPEPIRLDDLYHMVASIYGDKNLARTATATFSHFVEVCGMLSIHARNKKREGFDVTDALCKALGWYFPLLAKLRVSSVEELVFAKFPGVCPYCRQSPHRDAECKQVLGTNSTVNHHEVTRHFSMNWPLRPKGLDEWQAMFQRIYPRSPDDRSKSIIGLFEELGELAEAVRVFEAHPKYFLGEAADTFSYLMGIANEHALRLKQEQNIDFSLEQEFLKRFPGLCSQCGSRVCVCPSVPSATIGRMAKELSIPEGRNPFASNSQHFEDHGAAVSKRVLDYLGGYREIAKVLPIDRGDTNRAIVLLCLSLADSLEQTHAELADGLRAEALKISSGATPAGAAKTQIDVDELIAKIREGWSSISFEDQNSIVSSDEMVGEMAEMLAQRRILFVNCAPVDQLHIRVTAELRAVRTAVEATPSVTLDDLPAATVEDLAKRLMKKDYDILHFSGHADHKSLIFESQDGRSTAVPLSAIEMLIAGRPSIKCVILNACSALSSMTSALADTTIGVSDSIEDDAAIAFSTGFYEKLCTGSSFEEAFDEGKIRVALAGYDTEKLKLLRREVSG
jgi:NTP pyrophosphatase (non-canonical NTP hydrolase)